MDFTLCTGGQIDINSETSNEFCCDRIEIVLDYYAILNTELTKQAESYKQIAIGQT